MTNINGTVHEIAINVGPLNGLASLAYRLAPALADVSREFVRGRHPEVVWDLRNVIPRYQSMATLTAFLSIAHRLRQFTGHAHKVLLQWNPKVLSFWSDIRFLELTKKYDLIEWPGELLGGYPSDVTNPSSVIIDFPLDDNIPDHCDLVGWTTWKDLKREEVKDELMLRCGRLFEQSRKLALPERVRDQIAITSAELIVNSLLHGKSMAFLGMQRTGKRITVAVCDAGVGFVNSLQLQHRQWSRIDGLTSAAAILIGSIENTREMGLRRAIEMTVQVGGHVLIFSNDAEVWWDGALWDRAKHSLHPDRYVLPNLKETLGLPATGTVDLDQKREGYYRYWRQGLRGTRIAFEIQVEDQ